MESPLGTFDHPAWVTAGATLVGYGAILLGLFVLLFVVPAVLFTAL